MSALRPYSVLSAQLSHGEACARELRLRQVAFATSETGSLASLA
jgi:hypothetical protein